MSRFFFAFQYPARQEMAKKRSGSRRDRFLLVYLKQIKLCS
jgi:hypothetical protein